MCTGAPCASGLRLVSSATASNMPAGIGRIVTTRGQLNTPAGTHGMAVWTKWDARCCEAIFYSFSILLWNLLIRSAFTGGLSLTLAKHVGNLYTWSVHADNNLHVDTRAINKNVLGLNSIQHGKICVNPTILSQNGCCEKGPSVKIYKLYRGAGLKPIKLLLSNVFSIYRTCQTCQPSWIFVPYPVHADVCALLHVSDRDSNILQSSLEAEATSQIETHHVWPRSSKKNNEEEE